MTNNKQKIQNFLRNNSEYEIQCELVEVYLPKYLELHSEEVSEIIIGSEDLDGVCVEFETTELWLYKIDYAMLDMFPEFSQNGFNLEDVVYVQNNNEIELIVSNKPDMSNPVKLLIIEAEYLD
jgi:hypothetical protein